MIEWLTIWLDFSAADRAAGARFWDHTAGSLTEAGQLRLGPEAPASRVRLGVGVAEVKSARMAALAAGGVRAPESGETDFQSPAGFGFTLEALDLEARVAPVREWPDGHRSRVDQLTIDIAPEMWQAETSFWRLFTGWEVSDGTAGEFARLHTPTALPIRILLQRKQEGGTSAHLDIATDNRELEVARLKRGGAHRVGGGTRWTVLQPPVGPPVCVTDRDPATGLLAH